MKWLVDLSQLQRRPIREKEHRQLRLVLVLLKCVLEGEVVVESLVARVGQRWKLID